MARRTKRDPLAKRHDENDLQWRSRVARTRERRSAGSEAILTPETAQKGLYGQETVNNLEDGTRAVTYRKRSTSSLARLCARGVLTDAQLIGAQDIAEIMERIGKDVRVGASSLAARVDNENSGGNYGGESLHRVCLEQAYSAWRRELPLPRGLVLDMIREDHQLADIAKRHHRGWRAAIVMLRGALDSWHELKAAAFKRIDQDDVDAAERRVA